MGFNDLYGNKRIKHILTSYLRHNITPHSMIFSGPKSANILEFALGFAKALNCLNEKADFCNTCRNCTEALHDSFIDLRIMRPDGQNYKKEQILYIVEDNYKRPGKGNYKIYIMEDAHLMNESSGNAFLKVLEEPALSNVFIMLTDNLNGFLSTIKSRCQILKFSPLSKNEIKEYLIKKGEKEETAELKAYLSQSNMDGVFTSDFDQFMEKRLHALKSLTALILNKGADSVLIELFKETRSREKFIESFTEMINFLTLLLRDIMVLMIDPQSSQYLINVDFQNELLKLKNAISIDRVLSLIREMEFLLRDVQRNLNTKVLIQEFIRSFTGTVEEANYV